MGHEARAPISGDDRLSAYAVAGRDVLLVFRKGTTGRTVTPPSGTIPGHGGDGALHVAFAIGKDKLVRWEAHLAAHGVAIEGRNDWEQRLFPRSRRAPIRTGYAGIVVGVLGARVPEAFVCLNGVAKERGRDSRRLSSH